MLESGYRYLPSRVERKRGAAQPLSATDRRTVAALAAVMAITVFQSMAYYQLFNVNPIWIQRQVAPTILGFQVPIPWYQASNSFFAIVTVPLVFAIWRAQARRGREPSDIGKIGAGAWLSAVSNLILVAGIVVAGGGLVHPIWPVLYSLLLGISFLYYWPTLLALVSRAAPAKVNATLMGFAFMSLFLSNTLIGWIGGWYERMSPVAFWSMHAAIGAIGGLAVFLFGKRLDRILRPAD